MNSTITMLRNYSNSEQAIEIEKLSSSFAVIKRNNIDTKDNHLEALECFVVNRNTVILHNEK